MRKQEVIERAKEALKGTEKALTGVVRHPIHGLGFSVGEFFGGMNDVQKCKMLGLLVGQWEPGPLLAGKFAEAESYEELWEGWVNE